MKNSYIFSTNVDTEKQRLEILNNLYNQHTISILDQYLKPNISVLELAFGEGHMADHINNIPNIEYIGIDQNAERVNKRASKKGTYLEGDITNLQGIDLLENKKVDGIIRTCEC